MSEQNEHIFHTFGCRSPTSAGTGKWDGAFLYAETYSQKTVGVFKDRIDYIGNGNDFDVVIDTYNKLISEGWQPMSVEDIEKTAGIKISNETNLIVSDKKICNIF